MSFSTAKYDHWLYFELKSVVCFPSYLRGHKYISYMCYRHTVKRIELDVYPCNLNSNLINQFCAPPDPVACFWSHLINKPIQKNPNSMSEIKSHCLNQIESLDQSAWRRKCARLMIQWLGLCVSVHVCTHERMCVYQYFPCKKRGFHNLDGWTCMCVCISVCVSFCNLIMCIPQHSPSTMRLTWLQWYFPPVLTLQLYSPESVSSRSLMSREASPPRYSPAKDRRLASLPVASLVYTWPPKKVMI